MYLVSSRRVLPNKAMDPAENPRAEEQKFPPLSKLHRDNVQLSEFRTCGSPPLTEECAIGDSDEDDEEMIRSQRIITQSRIQQQKSPKELRRKVMPFHWSPMLLCLSVADLEACMRLEHASMLSNGHTSSRDQIEYRLRRCGSLCFGLFNTCPPNNDKEWWIQTVPYARPVETGRKDGSKSVMFAHIIATLGSHPLVADNDILIPEHWRDAEQKSCRGHQMPGRTICLHSFSVCPEVQGIGIGKSAMKAYMQRMNQSGIADRIALICPKSRIGFFSRVGFQSAGQSETTVAGPGWYNMICHLPGPKARFWPE